MVKECKVVDISWPGVVLAIVVGMIVAFVWYQKGPIADAWEKLTGVTAERIKPVRGRSMIQLLLAVTITAVGLALAIAITATATGDESAGMAFLVGLIAWVAFSATTLLQHNAFELKPVKLTAINVSYQLVLFTAMSLTIGIL